MLIHYLRTTIRHLFRHKLYAGITITGLAIGIACSILIGLYVYDEFDYDRFHTRAERIYRLTQAYTAPGEQTHLPYVGPSVGPALMNELPGIEQTVQWGITAPVMLGYEETYIVPAGTETYYTTPTVFEVFTFPLIAGDPATALTEPYTIVLSESLAHRFFGDADPLGQLLYFNVHGRERQALRVTGILDAVPSTSHLQFEALVSFATLEAINRDNPAWEAQWVATYLLLEEKGLAAQLERQLHDFMVNHVGETQAATRTLHLQPLLDIHLYAENLDADRARRGDRQLVLLLLAIAVGIILMASINFMNLATARSADRAREIGVRKSFGAHRRQLMFQFLSESVLFAGIALLIGLVLVELALPAYNTFTGKALRIVYDEIWYGLLGFAVVVGILSGAYPALFLSVFQPIDVLKGRLGGGTRRGGLRKVLVVIQFSIATLLLIATGVVYQQLRYIQEKDLGFEKAGVLQTVIPSGRPGGNDLFKQELLHHPNILQVGRAVVRPLYEMHSSFPTTPTLAEVDGEMIQPETPLRQLEVGYDFLEAFAMRLLAGRSFSEDRPTDATEAFILNEAAVRAVGWASPEEALGKTLHYDEQRGTVIGVLADFHFESLHATILPFVLRFNKYSPMVFVKIGPGAVPETIVHIRQIWEKYTTSKEPFHYQFMDEVYDDHYTPEKKLQTILMSFALLALFITCLGVLGLTAFTIEGRKKEIGIRKVLGASAANLVALVSKEMLRLFVLSNLLAWPLAYYGMNYWLANFAYRADPGVLSFVVSGLLVGVITFATMGYQAFKAAQANPVDTLRHP